MNFLQLYLFFKYIRSSQVKSTQMLLKSLHWRARQSQHLQEHDVRNLCLVLDVILHDIVCENNVIWPWRNQDHRTLLKHYPIIADRLRAYDPMAFPHAVMESARAALSNC